jgi:pimeloyl-ACP methyl ester carboxylesterase
MNSPHQVTLDDGSRIDYFVDDHASPEWPVLVFHHGTPAAGPLSDRLMQSSRDAQLRLVELVRPGYGGSTRMINRSIADVAPLVAALVDHLEQDRFVSLGWSGGGPHVLATAALLPDRCAAALCLAGVVPFDADGVDFFAGMGEDNIAEFSAATTEPEVLRAFLATQAEGLQHVTGDDVIDMLQSLLPDVDQQHLTGDFADQFAQTLRWSVSKGIEGWFDDDVAFIRPWGFDLKKISVPVHVWHGDQDLMAPFTHGQWLAQHVPHAHANLAAGEGHLSMMSSLTSILHNLRSQI